MLLPFSLKVAFEIVNFCCEHTEKLQSTNVMWLYFPNLFKILAWFPRTFLNEFIELLPAIMSEKTYIEVSTCTIKVKYVLFHKVGRET